MVTQKPTRTSKSKDHMSCLEIRMMLWNDGNLNELLLEGRAIQGCLNTIGHSYKSAQSFAKLIGYRLIINIIEFLHLILLKFRFDAYFECGMKANIKKKTCIQNVWYLEKKYCSPAGFKPATSWMQVSCSTHWAITVVVFNRILLEFSPVLHLQPAAEHKLTTALAHYDKLKVGRWWVYVIRQFICWYRQSHVSYWHDRQTEGQDFNFIYR